MGYGFVGAPFNYNGTGATGGDSSKHCFPTSRASSTCFLHISFIRFAFSSAVHGLPNLTADDEIVDVENLNQWYQPGDQAYIIVASAMVLVMIPGLGFLYSGLARRKSALSMIWACMASFSVITFQWYFWGYSLTFSPTATSGFIGDLTAFGLKGVLGAPSPGSPLIPELLYSFYQVRKSTLTMWY